MESTSANKHVDARGIYAVMFYLYMFNSVYTVKYSYIYSCLLIEKHSDQGIILAPQNQYYTTPSTTVYTYIWVQLYL